MASDSGTADTGGATDFAASDLDKLTGEIGSAGSFDRTDFHDPEQLLEYKQAKIDADHQGLRGAIGSLHSAVGIQPSYQHEMDVLSEAQRYAAVGDGKASAYSAAQKKGNSLRELQAALDAAAANETKTAFQQQLDAINQNYADQRQAADQVQGHTYWSQGFHSHAEANAY